MGNEERSNEGFLGKLSRTAKRRHTRRGGFRGGIVQFGVMPGADLGATPLHHRANMAQQADEKSVSELTNPSVFGLPSLWILFCDIIQFLLIV